MGIKEGEPWPTMAMKVGVGRASRESGVMDAVRVRMYSWQFWWLLASSSNMFRPNCRREENADI